MNRDNIKQNAGDMFARKRTFFLAFGALAIAFLCCSIALHLKNNRSKEPELQDPVYSDTVIYTVKTKVDKQYFTSVANSEMLVAGFRDWTFRSREEYENYVLGGAIEMEAKEPPYAWTGCYGDVRSPFAMHYGRLGKTEITISSFPGVKVEFDIRELCVVEAGKKVFSCDIPDDLVFLDLNGDNFPELLVETTGRDDNDDYDTEFVAYDFFNRRECSCRFKQYDWVYILKKYDSVDILYDSKEEGFYESVRKTGDFVIRDGELTLVERIVTEPLFIPSAEPALPFCWFDYDHGDRQKGRAIRLPEYPGCYFTADKNGLKMVYEDSESGNVPVSYSLNAPVSVYFVDFDGDGKRELFTAETGNNLSRHLYRFAWDERERRFESDTLYEDARFGRTGSGKNEDKTFASHARYLLENGKLCVVMMDPLLQEQRELRMEIVDFRTFDSSSPDEDESREESSCDCVLLRESKAGEVFASERYSLVVLSEYPKTVIDPALGTTYSARGSKISYMDILGTDGYYFRPVFADLDGDGKREICVYDRYVLNPADGAVLAELDLGYYFTWFNDEIWVAKEDWDDYEELGNRLVGRPVLRDRTIEIRE